MPNKQLSSVPPGCHGRQVRGHQKTLTSQSVPQLRTVTAMPLPLPFSGSGYLSWWWCSLGDLANIRGVFNLRSRGLYCGLVDGSWRCCQTGSTALGSSRDQGLPCCRNNALPLRNHSALLEMMEKHFTSASVCARWERPRWPWPPWEFTNFYAPHRFQLQSHWEQLKQRQGLRVWPLGR